MKTSSSLWARLEDHSLFSVASTAVQRRGVVFTDSADGISPCTIAAMSPVSNHIYDDKANVISNITADYSCFKNSVGILAGSLWLVRA
jgi:hypothetical protein